VVARDAQRVQPDLRGVSLLVFDLDGTLIDSKRDLADAVNRLLVACGAAALPVAQVGRMVGDGAAMLVARAFVAARVEPPPDALTRFLAIYDTCLLDHTRPYAGVEPLLERVSGCLALALLTNKPAVPTRRILDGLGLARFFRPPQIVCGDGPLPRKPDPAGLLSLAASVGARPSDVVLVGDSVVDRRTARAAGSISCVASYGFGFDVFPMDELDADAWVIDSPDQLSALL
jgi:phosphoglycolate phosphatase